MTDTSLSLAGGIGHTLAGSGAGIRGVVSAVWHGEGNSLLTEKNVGARGNQSASACPWHRGVTSSFHCNLSPSPACSPSLDGCWVIEQESM